ncbi:MAG: hypothetical protein J7619_31300 [Dyadobacter sp.]|uniref:hypothetical protein n=1 Tax=Dyadobacter sp. TaxID=1914288 RepID=UPI001B2B84E8|nr:hypothetical protein [Dyadobacter sp.]MBO9617214.1 hypothetical protein [Dyadobacter sp.]
MQKIYITTARVLILIAIAAILMLLIQFKLQHWEIGATLPVILGVLTAIVLFDMLWSRSRGRK